MALLASPRAVGVPGSRVRYGDETWEEPILAQMAGLELDDETIGAVVGALGSAPRPVTLDSTGRCAISRSITLAG